MRFVLGCRDGEVGQQLIPPPEYIRRDNKESQDIPAKSTCYCSPSASEDIRQSRSGSPTSGYEGRGQQTDRSRDSKYRGNEERGVARDNIKGYMGSLA